MAPFSAAGIFFIISLVVLSTAAAFFTFLPIIPLAILHLIVGERFPVVFRLFNSFFDRLQEEWVKLLAMHIEFVLRLRLAYTVVTAPTAKSTQLVDMFLPPKQGKFKIIIANHRCRIDWLMMFVLLSRTKATRTLRVVLKDELSRLPIFGWSMQLFRYVFLSRKWAKDETRMREMVEHYRSNGGATILLFPEGTDLSEANIAKSNAYAARNGLPCFHHVLNPRATGFVALKNMIGAANIEEIIDVTMGYTDFVPGERPSEASVVNGRMPRKLHFLCTRHRVGDGTEQVGMNEKVADVAPDDDDRLRIWLNERFSKKELLLSQFYASNPVGFEEHHVRSVYGDNCTVITYNEDENAARDVETAKVLRSKRNLRLWHGVIRVIAIWMPPVLYWIFYSGIPQLLLYGVLIFMCVWATHVKGGLDQWLLVRHQGDDEQNSFKKD